MIQLKNSFKNYADVTRNFFAFTIFLFIVFSSSFAQIEDVKRVTKQLCSPSFHGRGYVNGGDSIAADYIIQEFQNNGLMGVAGNFYQRFSFPVNTYPERANFSVNGKKLTVGVDILPHAESPSFIDTLRYKIIRARDIFDAGKIVSHLQQAVNGDEYNSIALDFSGLPKDSFNLVKNFKYELAQFIPVIVLTEEKMIWSVGRQQLAFPIFELRKELGDENEIVVQLDATLNKNHTARNVFGYVPALKKSKKTIVVCAHYDHLGRLGQDVYFPGANDNASGTAMMMSLAKHYKLNPAKYNMLFIAFAGEEAGILGSKYFVENPPIPLEEIAFVINLDILGSGEEGITVVNGSIFPKHFEVLKQINEEKQLLKTIKARGYAANSDHYWFSDAGIPSFFIYTMGPNKHYHDPDDQFEKLSFAEVVDIHTLLQNYISSITTKKIKETKEKNKN